MIPNVLKAVGVGKSFCRFRSEWQRILSWTGLPIRPEEERWVLRGANLELNPGEALGIIGANGAGKSTLLKLITGTMKPTEGNIEVKGRVSAILELGLGFNAELTGRQNARQASSIMGFNAEEVERIMPGIENFAEVGDYFDQPLRVYSSGMLVRVAFAVVTAVRPDLLIVDEALAVGDVYFQQKCHERMREFISSGTALLFVSHGMDTVLEICSRALYLREGKVIHDGSPKEAVDLYQADMLVRMDRNAVKPQIV
ncbi:MAG: ABC transporter ATP-binding protein, partial [Planctomycetes bacterium]|nr:ABC transporter ATP-binding protein [Planctomycetota bacterium]